MKAKPSNCKLSFTMEAPEVWKDVVGLEGLYTISSLGNVRTLRFNRLKKSYLTLDGYINHSFIKDKIRYNFGLHRLIALHFIPNPLNKQEVNHKNGNKLDFSIGNLEWVTPQENIRHAHATGLIRMPKGGAHYKARPVLHLPTGIFFSSIVEAASTFSIHITTIRKRPEFLFL